MNFLDPILYPLARLAIRRGWGFPTLADRLRHAYVAAARDQAGPDATDSRLSVLTGLQRRDIARLRMDQPKSDDPRRQPLAEIIALWWADPAYDPKGIPVLGDGGSFAHLAQRIRKDVHSRTFLDILIEIGAVQEADGIVRLMTRTYQPLPGSDDQLAYLADNVGDHLKTAVANVTGAADKFDVSVHYRGLSEAAIADLDALWRQKQTKVLLEMNDAARNAQTCDDDPHRFRAGAYFHEEAQ